MKRLLTLTIVATLLIAQQLTSPVPILAKRDVKHEHTVFLVGLSEGATLSISNPADHPILVTVTPIALFGLEVGLGRHDLPIGAKATTELIVSQLGMGLSTVSIQSNSPFEAYAYEESSEGQRADFVPGLSAEPGTTLIFPRLFKGDTQAKEILLFNPSGDVVSTEIIAIDDSGFEIGRSHIDPMLPRHTRRLNLRDLREFEIRTASVLLISSAVGLVGRQRVISPLGDELGLPAFRSGQKNWSFATPAVDQEKQLSHKIHFYNNHDSKATLSLTAFSPTGVALEPNRQLTVAPYATAIVDMVNNLPLSASAVTTHSDLELIAYDVITHPHGRGVAAVTGVPNETLPVLVLKSTERTLAARVSQTVKNEDGKGEKDTNSTPSESATSSLDDYPFKNEPPCPAHVANCPSNTIDPYRFFYRECTSFVAWRMNRDAGTTDPKNPSFTNTMKGGRWSNAGNWSANAVKLGYQVDKNAAVGAIAQWNAKECSNCGVGHVAYVEAVNADGTVNLSEYNYETGHGFGFRKNVPVSKIGRFIHIRKSSSGGAAKPTVIASVRILTPGPWLVNQPIKIAFDITNRGGRSITFNKLLAGGRRNGDVNCQRGPCPDFPAVANLTLDPGQSFSYTQTQSFSVVDDYNFFAAYLIGSDWVTNVDQATNVSNNTRARITAISGARPVIIANVRLLTAGPFTIDQTIKVTFEIMNRGGSSIVLKKLLVGGRRDGDPSCRRNPCPDFPALTNVTLNPGQKLTYTRSQMFSVADDYSLFAAYLVGNNWVTNVPADSGVKNSTRVRISNRQSKPKISKHNWNPSPRANRLFDGKIQGQHFVKGDTQLRFCVQGGSKCYRHPSAGVVVDSASRMSVYRVKLSRGSWQVVVRTVAGDSVRSTGFKVK